MEAYGTCAILITASLGAAISTVTAQDYPSKPIRLIASGVGGGSDITARLIGAGISASLGQPIIVENRPGILQGETTARSAADGYTVMIAGTVAFTSPFIQKASYDGERDFAAVTLTDISPNVLVVHPSLPVKSVKELIALARAKPSQLNYGATAIGGTNHLATALFRSMAGIDITNIQYKATGAAVNDLIGGQLHMMLVTALSVMPHVKSGRVRALGVSSPQPSQLAPGIPTIASEGVPGYEASGITGAYVPVKTPVAIINRLNRDMVRYLTTPDAREKFLAVGSELVPNTPEKSDALIKADTAKWAKLINELGIRAQ